LVIGTGHGHDPRAFRNRLPFEAERESRAIKMFSRRQDNRAGGAAFLRVMTSRICLWDPP
jgi:hypothetical protein